MDSGKRCIGVTGGVGYVGSSLANYLAPHFYVRLLDIRTPSHKLEGCIGYHKCDVTHYEDVKKALEDVDLIIHTSIVQIPVINEQKRLGYEVNLLGTQNVCRAVDESTRTRGLILAGSWHAMGERGLRGIINEEFGFRPDKVEERARLYALSKIAQESVVRLYDEMSEKIFGIVRMGTVLGEGMSKETAANIFIENGLRGKPLTPYRHSMFRPMLYVDIGDVCKAYRNLAKKILNGNFAKKSNSLENIFNVYCPEPVTIFELAEIVSNAIAKYSYGKIRPEIDIIESNKPTLFHEDDKKLIKIDVRKALGSLGVRVFKSPNESIESIIRSRINSRQQTAICEHAS